MTRQETTGKAKQVTGRVKEAAGILTGDKTMERKGAQERVEGKVEENLGKARRKIGEVVDDVAKAIKK